MSTINRITGTNSGIDVDSVVKQSLSTEQNKIDKAYQQQKVYEYQQEQLKEIVTQSQDFYDKYLDILSGDSLLKDSAYESVSFSSTDINGNTSTAVTAKGYAGADVTNYEVTVTQLASKASTKLTEEQLKSNNTVAVKVGEEIISVDVKLDSTGKEVDMNATAKELNSALKSKGIDVTVKYSEISNGIVIESGDMGEKAKFSIAIFNNPSSPEKPSDDLLKDITFEEHIGKNAQGTIKKGDETYKINKPSNTFSVDNIQFTLNEVTADPVKSSDDLEALDINDPKNTVKIEKGGVTTEIKDGIKITKKTYDNVIISMYGDEKKISVEGLLKLEEGDGVDKVTSDGGKTITLTKGDVTTEIIKNDDGTNTTTTTKKLKDGTEVQIVEDNDGKKEYKYSNVDFNHLEYSAENAKITITSSDGKTETIKENSIITTSQIQKDGSVIKTEEINGVKTTEISNGSVTLSGKTDISNLKDTIVSFVDDYNKLMTSINEKLWEKRDTDYMPLTEDQKKEMSESQIESWEKKAQTGLLRSDSDLRRIQSAMKSAMSSMMSSTGLTLESIGIEPVDNYTTKNGTFKVDEDKLSKALQNNAEEVKDLFTRSVIKDSDGKITDKGGVLTQLQSVIKSEFKSSSSALSKRIGFDGTATASSNTLKKNIDKQKNLIAQLQEKYSTKETALYKKYSNLEVMLEKLNSQTNSLYSMLGISQ